MPQIKEINPVQAAQDIKDNPKIFLIDVRNPDEFEEVAASPAVCFPLPEFDINEIANELGFDKKAILYVICRSGARSYRAAEMCVAAGYEHVFNVAGGTIKWEADGLDVK